MPHRRRTQLVQARGRPQRTKGRTSPPPAGLRLSGQFVVEFNFGNGESTSARQAGGNAVILPIAFGDFTGTSTDAEGNVVDTFTEPGATMGSGK